MKIYHMIILSLVFGVVSFDVQARLRGGGGLRKKVSTKKISNSKPQESEAYQPMTRTLTFREDITSTFAYLKRFDEHMLTLKAVLPNGPLESAEMTSLKIYIDSKNDSLILQSCSQSALFHAANETVFKVQVMMDEASEDFVCKDENCTLRLSSDEFLKIECM